MWISKCVVETDQDRFVAETEDPSPDLAQARANLDTFLSAKGARLISLGSVAQERSVPVRPKQRHVTRLRAFTPVRLDLTRDQRMLAFEDLGLKEDLQELQALLFDPAAETWPTPLELPSFATPAVETFALIDAALSPAMPEVLEASGLQFASLFARRAAVDLSDVAPYLVRLTPDAPLTRMLLSTDPAPAGLWNSQCAIFLRSRIGMHALRRNLRNFTRLEGAAGQPAKYFRFYAASVFRQVIAELDPDIRRALLAGIDLAVYPNDGDGLGARVLHRGQIGANQAESSAKRAEGVAV